MFLITLGKRCEALRAPALGTTHEGVGYSALPSRPCLVFANALTKTPWAPERATLY